MAIRRSVFRVEPGDVLSVVGRYALVVAFTGVETVGLAVWLGFVDGAPVVSRASAVGLAVLGAALFVEHFLTDQAVNGVDFDFPVLRATVFSLTEVVLWAVWLLVADAVGGLTGLAVAWAVLTVLLVPQHTIEDNVLRGRGLLAGLVNLGTVGFSVVEATGATAWLLFVRRGDLVEPLLADLGASGVDPALVGIGVLALALLVEHGMGVRFSRRR